MEKVPAWIIQVLFGLLLTTSVAWITWATRAANDQETRITVNTSRIDGVDKSLDEIKDAQKEMNQKLDRLIERR